MMVVSSVGLVIMIMGIWNLANLKLTYYTTFISNFRFTAILLTFLQSNLFNICKHWKSFDLHCISAIHSIIISPLALDEIIGEFCHIFDSKSHSYEESMFSYHSRYKHISHSIWLISLRVNMLWLMIDQDLLEAMSCSSWSMSYSSVNKGLSLYLE